MESVENSQYIDDNGYYRYENSGQLVHRYIAAKYVVNRSLRESEVVHHINGNKLDNRPDNLQVMTEEEHEVLHSRKPRRKRHCSNCGDEVEKAHHKYCSSCYFENRGGCA